MSIPDLAIREIRARPVVVPLPRPIRTASGDVVDAPLLLVDVLTDPRLRLSEWIEASTSHR
jgi:mandelate racemase